MTFRVSGMTLGGKLSLSYLLVATLLIICGGSSSERFLMIFGFPLLYVPWAYPRTFGTTPEPPQIVGATVFALLWVGNAYFWGHAVAAVMSWVDRRCGSSRV